VGRKCGECEVGLRGLCKSAERGKVIAGRKMREEVVKKSEDGGEVEEAEVVKEEVVVEEKPVNAPADAGVDVEGQAGPP
jgi:endonuclease-3